MTTLHSHIHYQPKKVQRKRKNVIDSIKKKKKKINANEHISNTKLKEVGEIIIIWHFARPAKASLGNGILTDETRARKKPTSEYRYTL